MKNGTPKSISDQSLGNGAITPPLPFRSRPSRLKAGSIGPWGLAALAIGITSPAMGLYGLWGPMQALAGPITPLVFIAAMVMVLPTAVSYALLNRHMPSTGSAATWLWISFSPSLGYLAGLTMMTYFVMATVAQPLLFALFFQDLLLLLGLNAEGPFVLVAGILIATLPVAIACLRGAEASIRATIALMIAETIVVLALTATVLVIQGGSGAISLAPFDPGQSVNGISGFAAAMILGVLAFCGFDVVSTAAEEANAPRKYLPKAIVLTVVGMTIFWAFNAWAFTLAVSPAEVLRYNTDGLTAIRPLAERYWGSGALIVILTAFTGIVAVFISCMQGASRLVFVLARQSLLPPQLSQLSGSFIPKRAVILVLVATVVLDVLSILIIRNGMQAFLFWANSLVFFAVITFTAVNLANITLFWKGSGQPSHRILNLFVPIIGICVNLYLLYAAFFTSLANESDPLARGMVVICLVLFVIEVLVVIMLRFRRPALLAKSRPVGLEYASIPR